MVAWRTGLATSLAALVAALSVLGAIVGLGLAAWAAGLGCGVVMAAAVGREQARRGGGLLGPADLVTLLRVVLACAVAALVVESFTAAGLGRPVGEALVGLAVLALVLDAVDGAVARRTGTVSAFGARFDGEADAFLILVLSLYAAADFGAWVLALGAARYGFGAAGWVLPWLRAPLPFRFWRKVVTAVLGITLTLAAADVAPRALTVAALLVALALVAESFGRDVAWLWRHRPAGASGPAGRDPAAGIGQRA